MDAIHDDFTYPVAMYDHDEGTSITAGFAYHGRIPALRGKFVFGDIEHGRLFAADLDALKAADDGIPRTTAPIEEIQLYVRDADGAAPRRLDLGSDSRSARPRSAPRGLASEPEPRRRDFRDLASGRLDPHARAGFEHVATRRGPA